jgi:mannose-6-phosphate isomerase-like protein (cupin superfamily)
MANLNGRPCVVASCLSGIILGMRHLDSAYSEMASQRAATSCRMRIEFTMYRKDQARAIGARETRSDSFLPERRPAECFSSPKFWSHREEVRHPISTTARTRPFYLLHGALTIWVGDQTVYASQGDCAHLPRGIVHSFRNKGRETARMLVTATPSGIEKFFEEACYPAVEAKEAPPLTPELIARLMAASARHGQKVLPPGHS